jgi:DNA topoisomerase VI subunit B
MHLQARQLSMALFLSIHATVRGPLSGACPDSFEPRSGLLPRNEPNVHESAMRDNPSRWHGAELSLIIAGHWQYYRAKILKYLRQIAVITPYAQFAFRYSAVDDRNNVAVTFVRRTDKMPLPPRVDHPAAMHVPSKQNLACLLFRGRASCLSGI